MSELLNSKMGRRGFLGGLLKSAAGLAVAKVGLSTPSVSPSNYKEWQKRWGHVYDGEECVAPSASPDCFEDIGWL